jgi:hypothetical protein
LVEGESGGSFAASGLAAHAQPGVDLSVGPSGALVGLGEAGAGAGHLFLVHEVGLRRVSSNPFRSKTVRG